MYQHKDLLFYRLSEDQFSAIPLYENSVPAGFPSPAENGSKKVANEFKLL